FLLFQVARLRIRRKPGTRIVLNVKNNCESTKSLSVPCNVEVTTTNFSSDMSTNTTVTTTTASNPSPERSFASQRFSVCPSIASQVIEESSIIQIDSNPNANGSSPSPNADDPGLGCEIDCPNLNSTFECNRNHLSTSSPAKECLIPPTTPSNRSGLTTPIHSNPVEREKYTSENCGGSTIDIDDDWNLIGQEISVTSDVVVTCDSRGTSYHYASVTNKDSCMESGKRGKSNSSISKKNKANSVKNNSKRKALRITTSLISPNKEKSTRNYGSCGRSSRMSSTNGRDSLESKRERKAAKTLAIITGIFVICWLPFFIVALLSPICGPPCDPPALLTSLFQWLGYVNSMLNPVIYTIFSADFRTAFKKILLGKRAVHRSQNRV
ncbi:muscarinic acetylcholine receptor M5-like, partial [Tetranychus urticae]|uniref:muscarinic acetylcholine receptor M5-like n=1 Tax=Tetranychus urticae TaxID=32264 RepID=UPI000D65346D